MKGRQIVAIAFTTGLVLIAGLCLLLLTGPSRAQGPAPESQLAAAAAEPDPAARIEPRIPIQGRLTDDAGTPLEGFHQMRFRLYDSSSGGTVLCAHSNWVYVERGLFNTDIFGCSAPAFAGKALYLGVKVGTDPEMTPRRAIYPVPYAWSLRPGARISETLSNNAVLHVQNDAGSGRAIRAYALATTGTNYAMVGATKSPDGYGGYFYSNAGADGDGAGLDASSTNGTAASFEGHITGVDAISHIGTALLGKSGTGTGVFGSTDAADRNYGIYTPDNCAAHDYHYTGSQMQIVQNGGQEPLEPGDVAVFSGVSPLPEWQGAPLIQVTKATTAGSTAVAGVVKSWYNVEVATGTPEELARGGPEVTRGGPVATGEYLLLVVQGPARVKASALGGAIQPGDLLTSASQPGHAATASAPAVEGATAALPGTILGKALEPLPGGDGLIYIYVTLD